MTKEYNIIAEKNITSSKRIALVVGNANYSDVPLRNAVHDAQDMATALKKANFQVTLATDVSRSQMRKEIRLFGEQIKRSDVGLFYYAGHGMQVNGRNFLMPVGTDIQMEDEVEDEAVDVGLVLRKMENANNCMNIVILDACRNNPFERCFRTMTKGLAQIEAPGGSLIVYATAPGKIAVDGTGHNGVFTQHFIEFMEIPNLEISRLLRRVRVKVKEETKGIQIPWESSSLEGDFYFIRIKVPNQEAFSLEDLEEKSSLHSVWQSNLEQMREAFNETLEFQKKGPNDKYKIQAWCRFLTSFADGNPYTREDDRMRHQACILLSELLPEFTFLGEKIHTCGKIFHKIAEYRHKKTNIEFSLIPGGTFLMGSYGNEYEAPQHEVTVLPFLMSKCPVTQEVWKQIMGMNPSKFLGDTKPVEMVAWQDCQEFCQKTTLSLPSEAQWEYACRAGTKTWYYWGEDMEEEYCWFIDNAKGTTHSVGEKKPNSFGLYDMSGNIWEWCQDLWHDNYEGAPSNGHPWLEGENTLRVCRGGGYWRTAQRCRSAGRDGVFASSLGDFLGFRVVANLIN